MSKHLNRHSAGLAEIPSEKKSRQSEAVKAAAAGRWLEIYRDVCGLPDAVLSRIGRGQPCPKCQGTDRFIVFKDANNEGGLRCRQCHPENTNGLDSVMWLLDVDFSEACSRVGAYLGVVDTRKPRQSRKPAPHVLDSVPHFEDTVRAAAVGRWCDVLKTCCGVRAKILGNPKPQSCPKCEAVEAFQVIAGENGDVQLNCRKCHHRAFGGFHDVSWLNGVDYRDAVELVAEYLQVPHPQSRRPAPTGAKAAGKWDESRRIDTAHLRPSAAKPIKLNPEAPGPLAKATKSRRPSSPTMPAADRAISKIADGLVRAGQLPEKRAPDSVHWYRDENGETVGASLRWDTDEGKVCRPVAPGENGEWAGTAMPTPRPLYALPELLQANIDEVVWVVEGERCVEELRRMQLVAVTSCQGAESPGKTNWSHLRGRVVRVMPDNDSPGERYATTVMQLAAAAGAKSVGIVRLKDHWSGLPEKGDIVDWSLQHSALSPADVREVLESIPVDFGEVVPARPDNRVEAASLASRPTEQASRAESAPFEGVDVSELAAFVDAKPDWLVEGVFTSDEPTLFGARSKCCKTLQLTDLAVALSTGTPWLGHFNVPQPRRVLFVTGEANLRMISRHLQKAISARGLSFADVAGQLRIEAGDFPQFATIAHRDSITATIAKHGIDVVILDPLYRGLANVDTYRMSEVGGIIKDFQTACRPASFIVSHHVTKQSARDMQEGKSPSLEDLSGAGLAESCGQWWLVGRNSKYAWDWSHDLCVEFGGREGQGGGRRIVFNEQAWTFKVENLSDYRDDLQGKREELKREEESRKYESARAAIQKAMRGQPARSKNAIEKNRTDVPEKLWRRAFDEMIADQTIVEAGSERGNVLWILAR
jgi:hypothetical protein